MKKRSLRMVFVVVTILMMIIPLASNCSKERRAGEDAAAPQAVAVEVAPVLEEAIIETVITVGTIEAMQDVMVSSETAGRVIWVPIKVGDLVRPGQVLVQVDDELKAIAVEQAQAQCLAAETNFTKMEKDLQRAEKIFASAGISDADLEAARLGLRAAEAQYKAAQVALKFAQRQLADTRIKSPIAGEVAAKYIDAGEMVAPGREIANIIDVSKVKVKLAIPEEEIGKIKKGQSVHLFLDTQPELSFAGQVYSVGVKSMTATGHAFPVEVIVDNNSAATLKAGMFARAEIMTASVEKTVTVAKECLVNVNNQPAVFVAEGQIAHLQTVQTGIRANNKVQILSGLTVGKKVISFGQEKLKDGASIRYE